MQAHDQYFQSGGVRLRYRDEGAGPPLVFIHGWTLDLEVWNPQAAALAGPLRVVRYDRRGFGLSDGTPGIAADLQDLAHLLDRLELVAPMLVGLSQGARVALAFALRQPDRVAGLVLDGPPDEVGDPAAAGDEDFSIANTAHWSASAASRRSAIRRRPPLMRLYGSNPAAADLMAGCLRATRRATCSAAAIPPPPAGVRARTFAKPVLVVNGEFDTPIRRRAGSALHGRCPLADRIVLPRRRTPAEPRQYERLQ
jgi:pimeloyl-ACP methyl ester carboxylesterase